MIRVPGVIQPILLVASKDGGLAVTERLARIGRSVTYSLLQGLLGRYETQITLDQLGLTSPTPVSVTSPMVNLLVGGSWRLPCHGTTCASVARFPIGTSWGVFL